MNVDLPHRAAWKKNLHAEDAGWDGEQYEDAVEIPCRREQRARMAAGTGGQEIRSHARYMVGPGHEVETDDLLDGDVVEAVDEMVDVSGEVLGLICYLEVGNAG